MKVLSVLKFTAILGVLLVSFLFLAGKQPASAAIQGSNNTVQSAASSSKNSNNSKDVFYTYKAQPGDSYTLMARKAVETYGLKYKVKLSLAGIVYAETNLTQDAGSPVLNLGQQVKIAESTIKPWVDRAQKLTKSEQTDWGYYVQFVDFDTSHVGQSG